MNTSSDQMDFFGGRRSKADQNRRDLGIERASHRADRQHDEWTETAIRHLATWCIGRGRFLCEEFRADAEKMLPAPPDGRAFGAVIRTAASRRIIKRCGFGPDQYCSPKTMWIAAATGGP